MDDVFIIGGGIFGLTASIVLGEAGYKVTLIEREFDVMKGASLVNQNRIHHGFHYPRSLSTCQEALKGFLTFQKFYGKAINGNFEKYYAISKENSKVSSDEFVDFAKSLNLFIKEKWPDPSILNRKKIDSCWITKEPIFDYHTLKSLALERITKSKNIQILRNCNVLGLEEDKIILSNGYKKKYSFIVNATYSEISDVSKTLGIPTVPAKFQLCILPILKSKTQLSNFGVTVMDGPFCSLMPKGFEKDLFILYHVSQSVNQENIGTSRSEWLPIIGSPENDIIIRSSEYFPILKKMSLYDSWITTRIVLPNQEIEDSRPTLVIKNSESIYTIFSGKLTTCVDSARSLLDIINRTK